MTQTAVATKQAEIEAYEAKITAAQATVQQRSENVFIVPSSRPDGDRHIVTTNPTDGVANYCSCKGWKYYHKCYCSTAVTRFVAAQQAIAAAEQIIAEEICNEQEQELGELSLIAGYVAQGVSRSTAEAIVNAKGVKSHGNAKAYEPKEFSLYR